MGNGVVSRREGKLTIRTAVPRTVLVALGSMVFAVFSALLCAAWFVTVPEQAAGVSSPASLGLFIVVLLLLSIYLLLGLAGLALFGWGMVFSISRLLTFRRPILEVGPDGILDRASAVGVGFVPWDEVKDVVPGNIMSQSYVRVRVHDEKELMKRQNPLKRLLIRINHRYFTGAGVNIPMLALAIPERELLEEMLPYLDPPARKKLEESLPQKGNSRLDGLEETSGRGAARVAKVLLRGALLFVLSLIYWVSAFGLAGTGVLVILVGFGVIGGEAFDPVTSIFGVLLVCLAALDFIYFPRLVKKLTGSEPMEPPPGA